MTIHFFVPGIPRPAGSKRAFINRRTGKPILTDANPAAKDWKAVVSTVAAKAMAMTLQPLFLGPVAVHVTFFQTRPKFHYRGGNPANPLSRKAPAFPTTKPDATKLWRGTEDALKGIIWKDDAQVVTQIVNKRYGDKPGCSISIMEEIPDACGQTNLDGDSEPSGDRERAADEVAYEA